MTTRIWTLLAALGLLTLPLAGCPADDDDDSSVGDDDDATGDDDDATGDDDDATGDDDDATGDDDDSAGDDDDSAGPVVTALTLSASTKTTDTRGTIQITITADWDDTSTTNPTEADGVVFTLANTGGTDSGVWAEPDVTSINAGTYDLSATYEGVTSNTLNLAFTAATPGTGDFIIHELLVDGTAGDANGDGTTNVDQDAFVEFLNVSGVELDLEGLTVTERDFGTNLPRHTFDAGDSVLAGQAVVVFGGGSADITPAGAFVTVADNENDPGTQLFLNLDPTGDIIALNDAAGELVSLAYGSEGTNGLPDANIDEAITLSPQISGTAWDAHSTVAGTADLFSPGTQADGSVFPE